ncbi:MAG: DJ-1/PfpI family protein [Bacteroidales bacterium]|jgi:4-methyl-5(b-hydroxyethyl)-thiazole monophosphate biosynthesis|nr:DJ-1/PfpI family protein [Bacteroidales bacterium]
MGTIYLFLATGFEETEAVAAIDVMRRGNLNVRTVSVTGNYLVSGTHDIPVKADLLFEDADFTNAAMLVLPGGRLGTENLNAHEALKQLLSDFDRQNRPLAAICAAPTVLGGLGILNGRKAVCYPGCESKLGKAIYTNAPVVVDGHIITGKGPAFAIEFGLAIVDFFKGIRTACNISHDLLILD